MNKTKHWNKFLLFSENLSTSCRSWKICLFSGGRNKCIQKSRKEGYFSERYNASIRNDWHKLG